jgi:hypothetical protein
MKLRLYKYTIYSEIILLIIAFLTLIIFESSWSMAIVKLINAALGNIEIVEMHTFTVLLIPIIYFICAVLVGYFSAKIKTIRENNANNADKAAATDIKYPLFWRYAFYTNVFLLLYLVFLSVHFWIKKDDYHTFDRKADILGILFGATVWLMALFSGLVLSGSKLLWQNKNKAMSSILYFVLFIFLGLPLLLAMNAPNKRTLDNMTEESLIDDSINYYDESYVVISPKTPLMNRRELNLSSDTVCTLDYGCQIIFKRQSINEESDAAATMTPVGNEIVNCGDCSRDSVSFSNNVVQSKWEKYTKTLKDVSEYNSEIHGDDIVSQEEYNSQYKPLFSGTYEFEQIPANYKKEIVKFISEMESSDKYGLTQINERVSSVITYGQYLSNGAKEMAVVLDGINDENYTYILILSINSNGLPYIAFREKSYSKISIKSFKANDLIFKDSEALIESPIAGIMVTFSNTDKRCLIFDEALARFEWYQQKSKSEIDNANKSNSEEGE